MGILTPGSVSATIGTSGVVFAATDAPTMDRLGRLHTFCHAAPGRWHVMGVTNGAGLSLRYFRDTFTPDQQLRRAVDPGSRRASGEQRVAVGSLSVRRAHASPRRRGASGIRRHHGLSYAGALHPGGARRRGLQPQGHVHPVRRARDPGRFDPAWRRRRAWPALAADPGRCLRHGRGAARSGRGVVRSARRFWPEPGLGHGRASKRPARRRCGRPRSSNRRTPL